MHFAPLWLHYELSLSESGYEDDAYQLSFKTKEYEYATTNLGADTNEVLFATIAAFVESILRSSALAIDIIRISPAGAAYSVEEIDQCMDTILASPKNKYSRKELVAEHNGFRIFDLYREIFGGDFLEEHYNSKNRAPGRARLFQMVIKKHFPDWEIQTLDDFPGGDFALRRRVKSPTE